MRVLTILNTRWSAALITVLLSASSAHAEAGKYLYAIGGSGDPPGDTTIFDDEFVDLAKAAKARGWKSTVLFDGGHKEGQQKVGAAFGIKALATFNKDSYSSMLNGIQADVDSGKLKKGDQVFLWINTHGLEKFGSQRSHDISCHKNEIGTCDLDLIDEVILKMESKGIRVAVMDLSCYSGSTLNLGSTKTCVLTSTSDQYPAYTNPFEQLTLSRPGASLEEIFLRGADAKGGYPQISTRAGKQLNYLFAPLLLKPDSSLDKIRSESVCADCSNRSIYNRHREIFQFTQEAVGTRWVRSVLFQEFSSALKKYEREYKKALQMRRKLNEYDSRTEDGPLGKTYWFLIARRDISNTSLKLGGYDCEKPGVDQMQICARASELERLAKLLQNNPEFRAYLKLQEEFDRQTKISEKLWDKPVKGYWTSGTLERAARKVRKEYRALYLELYRQLSKTSSEPEPCREYIF